MDATSKKLNPYEELQKQRDASFERDRQSQAEMREMAQRTIDAMEQAERQAARDAEAANEAAFRADELRKYLAAGGGQIQFNESWPRLRTEIIEQRYLSGQAAPSPETMTAAKRHLDLLYRR